MDMEPSTSRRKLKEENEEIKEKVFPGPAMKAELHQIPEILEIIFNYLDPWTVRNCRFVNKVWNLEACQQCKRTTQVAVQQVDSQHERFIHLLQVNKTLNLGLPFSFITVWVDKWNNSILHDIIKDTRLLLNLKFFDTSESNSNLHHYRLSKLLACSKLQSKLVALEFGCYKNTRIFLKSDLPVRFPKLKQFTVSNAIGDNETIEFLIRIINSSPNLEIMSLGTEIQRNFLVQIFERANFTKIIDFNFDISSAILPAKDILPSMEKMRATMVPETLNENFTIPRQLVREFSSILKELEIYWNSQEINVNLLGFPTCLYLTKLTVYNWGGHIGSFSFERLPSLKEICLFQDIIATDNFAFTSVHPGVEILRFNQGVLYPNDLILPSHFNRFLNHFAVQFPNINSMYITWHIMPETMQVILRKFSRLERLELNSKFGFHESIFAGSGPCGVVNVRNYWRNGFNWGSGDDNLTLACLKNLKYLRLQHGWNSAENPDYEFFPVTNRAIKEGVSKIPLLQTLRITWTSKLSVQTLIDHLSHVRNIEVDINIGKESQNTDTCHQLQMLWPQVKIFRVKHKCSNVTWMSKILSWIKSFLLLDD